MIAGDGFMYTTYVTDDSQDTINKSTAEPWQDAVYTLNDAFQANLNLSNFSAAITDLTALYQAIGHSYDNTDPLLQALQSGDTSTIAISYNALQQNYGLGRLCDSSGTSNTKLHFLRVGSDGSSSDVIVNQWTATRGILHTFVPGSFPLIINQQQYQTGPQIEFGNVNMITNADAGAVVSWQVIKQCYAEIQTDPKCPQGGENRLTTVTGGTIAADIVVDPIVPDQFSPLSPILQLADGSFVGTFNSLGGTAMVAFDASGGVRWTLPGYTPQMATADGGFIASAGSFFDPGSGTFIAGPAATFDATGAATGQLPLFPTQSWLGNGYQLGSVAQVTFAAINLATSFAAFASGNASENGTAAKQEWFPPLPTCTSTSMPCAGEATWNAFKSLKTLIAGSCPLCSTYAFAKLGATQQQFSALLNRPPLLSDGTASYGPMNHVMCNWYDIVSCPFGSETVAHYMQRTDASAVSRTPSPNGVVIFVNPVSVCKSGTAAGANLNEAMLFHEALHGLTGLYDIDLANALGIGADYDRRGSVAITYYLQNNVFGGTLTYFDPGPGNGGLVCRN